uniref:Remnant of Bacteriocin ABC-transporter SkgD n=1 Tax=Latilactobacillus sakei subsp. sakei (strain 23K) TaxID=314315 RepID=A0A2H1MY60_LATSS|nr:Remnant of Bacteriocin ABC-transporter SkgD [Latilactobacillus sakei subsp. sakei 23K]
MFNLLRYKKLYCSQVDEDDCGIAALNMIWQIL